MDEKRRLVQALNAGVTPEGQKLFMAISKTIGQQVTWEGSDILVFGDTLIMPPYRPENVRGNDERRMIYVKKLVESQWKDATPSAVAVVTTAPVAANPQTAMNNLNNMAASNGNTSNTSASSVSSVSSSSSVAAGSAATATTTTTTTSATNNNNNNNNSNNTPSSTSGASAN